MRKQIPLFALLLAALAVNAQVRPVSAAIDAAQTRAPITKYIYGQFIEHIAGIINNGLWAEMLEDRKFYYPVTARPPAPTAQPRRGPMRRWTPIGPEDSVVMDRNLPYVGIHAPLVKLNWAEARGLQQTGLAVRKGMTYTGRVVLAGDPGVKVTVNLVWGTNANQRQSVVVAKLGAA
jgi:alpha-L-arabinofuranosidase